MLSQERAFADEYVLSVYSSTFPGVSGRARIDTPSFIVVLAEANPQIRRLRATKY